MPQPTLHHHPSLETGLSVGGAIRPSLFDHKDVFIDRISPLAVAAIYFGGFSLAPQDASLSRQALFKLSFLNRHFLQPGGLRVAVDHQTAFLSGEINSSLLFTLGEILAHQIDGIRQVTNETVARPAEGSPARVLGPHAADTAREAIHFLFATDQTLRSGVHVIIEEGRMILDGEVATPAQKAWAEQLAAAAIGSEVDSRLRTSAFTPPPMMKVAEPPQLDDESLQALALFRLRLVRDTEHLHVRVKATRGVVSLQGKVPSETHRQRAEKLVRSTLGIRELRSSLSLT